MSVCSTGSVEMTGLNYHCQCVQWSMNTRNKLICVLCVGGCRCPCVRLGPWKWPVWIITVNVYNGVWIQDTNWYVCCVWVVVDVRMFDWDRGNDRFELSLLMCTMSMDTRYKLICVLCVGGCRCPYVRLGPWKWPVWIITVDVYNEYGYKIQIDMCAVCGWL